MSLLSESRDLKMMKEGKKQTGESPASDKRISVSSALDLSTKTDRLEAQTTSPMIQDKPASVHEPSHHIGPTPVKNGIPKSTESKRRSLSSTEQIKLDKEMGRIKEVISDVSTEAIQRVFRENWRQFLFDGYDDKHISFIMRAGLKNATPDVLGRVLKDDRVFGEDFQDVAARKPSIIKKVLKDMTVAQLSEQLPTIMINKIVADKIRDAPAKDLINWLAAGNRLGFCRDDILDVSDESVVPNVPVRYYPIQPPIIHQTPPFYTPPPQPLQHQKYQALQRPATYQTHVPPPAIIRPPNNLGRTIPPAHSAVPPPKPQARDQLLLEQENNRAVQDAVLKEAAEGQKSEAASKSATTPGLFAEDLVCNLCSKRLPTRSGYMFHTMKKVCRDGKATDGRWVCKNCDAHFIGKRGLVYHEMRSVCQKTSASLYSPKVYQPSKPTLTSTPTNEPAARLPSVTAAVQRPPMHTPKGKMDEPEYRMSHADLPPTLSTAMDAEIIEEDERLQRKMNELSSDLPEAERLKRETGYRNANATRKSQIRKSYNVSLRLRDNQELVKDAGSSPTSSGGRLEEFRAPSSSAAPKSNPRVPQANGLSPVNTTGNSMPVVGFAHTSHLNGGTVNQAYPKRTSVPGFGVFQNFRPCPVANMNYQQVHQSNKRQRTSEDDGTSPPGTGYNSPFGNGSTQPSGLAIVYAEDTATSYAKRASSEKKATPARKRGIASSVKMIQSKNIAVVLPSFAGSGTKESAYTIVDTSSEGDDDDDDDDDDDEDIPAIIGGGKGVNGGGKGINGGGKGINGGGKGINGGGKGVNGGGKGVSGGGNVSATAVDEDEEDETIDSPLPSIEAPR